MIRRNFERYLMCPHSDLTPSQKSAIENWEKKSADRCFIGTSPAFLTDIFVSINTLKETDPTKALLLEKDVFAICGIETLVAD